VPTGPLTLDVPVTDRPDAVELRTGDVLVLAVKTQDSVAALDAWAAQPVAGGGTAGERLPLLCVQNGVENERLALRRFRRVYGVCVLLPATYLTPGVIAAHGGPCTGALILGRSPSGTDKTGRAIAADLVTSHFLAPVVPDVMRWKYGKLLANLGNAVDAVCGRDAGPKARGLVARARAEATAVLDAAGIAFASSADMDGVRGHRVDLQPLDGIERGGGSSWQSLIRGTGTIETDYLNGEIVLLGRQHGVPTPVNEALQRAAAASAREGRAPGSLTVAELTALADAAPVAG
jgi:2-dehydropantoate 2-reductase